MSKISSDDAVEGAGNGLSRRDALKRGVVVGGAVVWAVPAVQALSMTAASAQSPSPTSPPPPPPSPPPPPPPPPPVVTELPSHGIFVVLINGVKYGIKFDGSSLTFDKVASPSDKAFLTARGFIWSNPTAAILAMFSGAAGVGVLTVVIPAGATLVAGSAYTFDGGLQNCPVPGSDKYQPAGVSGSTLTFHKECQS